MLLTTKLHTVWSEEWPTGADDQAFPKLAWAVVVSGKLQRYITKLMVILIQGASGLGTDIGDALDPCRPPCNYASHGPVVLSGAKALQDAQAVHALITAKVDINVTDAGGWYRYHTLSV